jgi:hypothetical protein
MPMNYTLVGEAVTFRTGIDTEAPTGCSSTRLRSRLIRVDEFLQTGWSVLIAETPSLSTKSHLLLLDVRQTPQPWPEADERWSCNCRL